MHYDIHQLLRALAGDRRIIDVSDEESLEGYGELGYAVEGYGELGAFGDYAVDVAEGDEELLGRVARARSRAVRANQLTNQFTPAAGVQKHGMRDLYLPFPLFSFTQTSGTTLTQIARPQRPFLPRRPILDTQRSAATLLQLPVVALLQIGDRPQSIGEAGGAITANAFAPTAFQTSLNMDRAEPGVAIGLTINLIGAALGAGETITIAAALIGHSVS